MAAIRQVKEWKTPSQYCRGHCTSRGEEFTEYKNVVLKQTMNQAVFHVTNSDYAHVTISARKFCFRERESEAESFIEGEIKMKSMEGSKRRFPSKGLLEHLKEQRVKVYIIRRCLVMLLCWQD